MLCILYILKRSCQAGGEITDGYITTAFRLDPGPEINIIVAVGKRKSRPGGVVNIHPLAVERFHPYPHALRGGGVVDCQKTRLTAVFRVPVSVTFTLYPAGPLQSFSLKTTGTRADWPATFKS